MEAPSSTIPEEVCGVIVDIKYISGLPQGCKYNIANKGYVSVSSSAAKIYRTLFTSESKDLALDYISMTVDKSVSTAKTYPEWKKVIFKELVGMKNAIANLKHVYAAYPECIARLCIVDMRLSETAFNTAVDS